MVITSQALKISEKGPLTAQLRARTRKSLSSHHKKLSTCQHYKHMTLRAKFNYKQLIMKSNSRLVSD